MNFMYILPQFRNVQYTEYSTGKFKLIQNLRSISEYFIFIPANNQREVYQSGIAMKQNRKTKQRSPHNRPLINNSSKLVEKRCTTQ